MKVHNKPLQGQGDTQQAKETSIRKQSSTQQNFLNASKRSISMKNSAATAPQKSSQRTIPAKKDSGSKRGQSASQQ